MLADTPATVSVGDASAEFEVTTPFEYNLFHKGAYSRELNVLDDLLDELEPDDVFYDVGAHVGLYSLLAADLLDDGRVYAFEPNPSNAETFERNITINSSDINVLYYALGDSESEVVLETEGLLDAHGQINDGSESGDGIQVNAVRADTLVDRGHVPIPSIIKIDIEGHELEALEGMDRLLSYPKCRVVYVECHPGCLSQIGDSVDAVVDLFRESGFEVSQIHETDNEQPFLKATKK
jgi:FkbM family methyltransferase